MKRVKIMLTVVAVLAIVGGALAFKAQRFTSVCFYSSTVKNACTNAVANKTTSTTGSGVKTWATTKLKENGICPTPPIGGFACDVSYFSIDEE